MKLPRKRFLIPITVLILLVLAASDFHRWVRQVDGLSQPEAPQADAIVALTGGSGKRIEAAIRLLESGSGDRLLVSGVHNTVNTKDLIATSGGTDALFECCIDIGRKASSTEGNAIESAEWVKDHDIKSLIVVTSDYHMPRAMLWYRHNMPDDLILIAYPMQSKLQPDTWWRSWQSFRGLGIEWMKYRVTTLLLAF